MTRVLVTEAYSASNIGDRELVDRSIDYAHRAIPNAEVICLAVDTASFDGKMDVPLRERLFPRLSYMRRGPLGRILTVAGWGTRIGVLTALSVLPQRTQRKVITQLCAAQILPPTAGLYAAADRVVAVGGGYLGDQYRKETLLTLWTWWWAGRLGAPVETMPLSYEVTKRPLRLATGALARQVTWRVRDTSSYDLLLEAGITAHKLPDLAFANYRAETPSSRNGTVLALVGSDYLSSSEQKSLILSLATAIAASKLTTPVTALSMHSAMATTHVGGDTRASEDAVAELTVQGVPAITVNAVNYGDVVDECSRADVVISARMHAGIAALCAGSRVGLLAYEEKHFALMRDLGLGDYVIDIRAESSEIAALVRRLEAAVSSTFSSAAMRYYELLAANNLTQRV